MVLNVVSVFDSAAVAFGRPFFTASLGLAVRSFTDEVNRVGQDNQLNLHPSDFVLYELGIYDDSNGRFTLLELPKQLVRAIDVFVKA